MCELLGMSSNLPATLSLSLMKLAEHGALSGPHKDGWGVGYYEGGDVRLIKGTEAAADSEWIRFSQAQKGEIMQAYPHRLLEKAEKACLVTNALKFEPTLVTEVSCG